MRILITGGAGLVGRKLAQALLDRGTLCGRGIAAITLIDVVAAEGFTDARVVAAACDIGDAAAVDQVVSEGFDAVFHMAAVVSAAAEADLDLGLTVNLDGTRNLAEAARQLGTCPLFVFASTCAVYGGKLPPVIQDTTALTPQTSYGAQKVMGEQLVGDFGRRGVIDGRSLRLPTVFVRPGKPNKAASTFVSSIVREPLQGLPAVCPVAPETAMYVLSPRKVVDAFIRMAELDAALLGPERALLLPGITVTVADTIAAVARIAGPAAAALITMTDDPAIRKIVAGWAPHFRTERAPALGFEADADLDAIIRQFIDDELGGRVHGG